MKYLIIALLALTACHEKHNNPPPVTTTTLQTTTTTLKPTTTTLATTTTTLQVTTTTLPMGVWCGGPDFSPPCPSKPGFDPNASCVLGAHDCSNGVQYVCKTTCSTN